MLFRSPGIDFFYEISLGEWGEKMWSVHFEGRGVKNAPGGPKMGSKMHAFFPKGGFCLRGKIEELSRWGEGEGEGPKKK